MSDFLARALDGLPQNTEPEPPATAAEDIPLSEWAASREEIGVRDNGDFIGLKAWRRPQRPNYQAPPSAMQQYAAEREKNGIREAPSDGVIPGVGRPATSLRTNHSPYRSFDTGRK